jgi:hypothetical protein
MISGTSTDHYGCRDCGISILGSAYISDFLGATALLRTLSIFKRGDEKRGRRDIVSVRSTYTILLITENEGGRIISI